LHTGAALLDLSTNGKLRILGSDRTSFLNNMVTNDVRRLHPGEGCNAAKLSLQGKMEAEMHVLCLEQELWCEVGPGPVDAVQRSLDRHLIMEDARIEDVTAEWGLLTVQGPLAGKALHAVGAAAADLTAPLAHAVRSVAGVECRVVRIDRSGEGGFDVWVPARRAAEAWRSLRDTGGARPAGMEAFEIRRIEAGIPGAGTEITGEYFPVEAGLEAGWISYTKGCYLGQETISRLHHLGHANRHLRGLELDGPSLPLRGSSVWAGGDRVGVVTSAAVSPRRGRGIALGYVHREHADPGRRLEVETTEGRSTARVTLLPFA
jgi:folate-binding protein YgfZ